MKELSAHIMEGMIHNIRTPLNLVLAYAQQLQKQGDNLLAEKIYKSGIRIDDIMQDTWEAMQHRSPVLQNVLLSLWLKHELKLLECYLPIKHRFSMEVDYPEMDVYIRVSSLNLSLWLEELLLFLVAVIPDQLLKLKISFSEAAMQVLVSCNDTDFSVWEQEIFLINDSSEIPVKSFQTNLGEANMQMELRF